MLDVDMFILFYYFIFQIYLKPTNISLELEKQNGLMAHETACFSVDRVHKADIIDTLGERP